MHCLLCLVSIYFKSIIRDKVNQSLIDSFSFTERQASQINSQENRFSRNSNIAFFEFVNLSSLSIYFLDSLLFVFLSKRSSLSPAKMRTTMNMITSGGNLQFFRSRESTSEYEQLPSPD